MGFLAPAVPWIVKGGAMLGASLLGKKAQSSAMKRSPEEQAALGGAQDTAGQLSETGGSLIGQGTPLTGQAANYWSTLLGGNRAAMSQATAGPRGAVTDIYRGAESNLERSGVRGASRDVAKAELGRDRAGKIAGLTTGVQPFAAQQLAEIGSDQTRTGANMLGQSGSIWGNLLGAGYQNRLYGRQEGEKFGGSMGGLLFDILSGTIGKMGKGGGGGGSIPTIPSTTYPGRY
jgi:hypothetical protein